MARVEIITPCDISDISKATEPIKRDPGLQGSDATDLSNGIRFAAFYGEVASGSDISGPVIWNHQNSAGVFQNPTSNLFGSSGIISTTEIRGETLCLFDGFGKIHIVAVLNDNKTLVYARCVDTSDPDNSANWKNAAEDTAGAEFLRNAPLGVLAEAVGGSYTAYGRISAHSGQPTVLGWNFHESQWRGGESEKGSRESDIERLYTTSNWTEALLIIQQYDILYVYIGALEHNRYAVNETKFIRNLAPVFEFGSVIIYEVP